MMKDLELIAETEMHIYLKTFGLSPPQAVFIFRTMWARMTRDPQSKEIEKAVKLIEDTFNV